tara:strand:+ start:277 stop:825 length:549 start_codon:yes stop_codon:yes gene_type:complete
LHYIQRNLFNDGWKHLHRKENTKWVEKIKRYHHHPGGHSGKWPKSPLVDLFLFIYRDNPSKKLTGLLMQSNIYIFENIERIDRNTNGKLVLPFRHHQRYEPTQTRGDSGLICDYDVSKEKIINFINENTPYSKKAKKSYNKSDLIKVLIYGDKTRTPYECEFNSSIISPQESSRRYLAKNAK